MTSNDAQRWWPTSPYDFVDTNLCPACFSPITQEICPHCGLALTDPRTSELLARGQAVLDAELRRQESLAQVRAAQRSDAAAAPRHPQPAYPLGRPAVLSAPSAARAADTVDPVRPAPGAVAVGAPPPAPPLRPLEPPLTAAAAASDLPSLPAHVPAPRARRLTVPVLLLIVGVSLVSVAAIFFLTLAWFFSDVAVRALIVAAVTVTAIVAASLLRRSTLTMTAEGIAVLGVVLIALDVWAVRANDLFGAGQVGPAVYAGVGMIAMAMLCRGWAVLSRLRAPDFAAVLAWPSGVGLLVAGLLGARPGIAVTCGLLGAAAGALIHRLPSPISAARSRTDSALERTILASVGIAALLLAVLSDGLTLGASAWTGVWLIPLVVALCGLHALAILRAPRLPAARPLAAIALATGTAATATAGAVAGLRSDVPGIGAFLAPVMAVAVAVMFTRVQRMPHPAIRSVPLRPARWTAFAAAALVLVPSLGQWLLAGTGAAVGWVLWRTPPFDVTSPDTAGWTLAAAVVVAALLFTVPARTHRAITAVRPLVAAAVLLVGAFASGAPAASVATGTVVTIAAVVALRFGATPRGTWILVTGLGAGSAFLIGLAHPALWLAGVVTAIAAPIALVRTLRPERGALVAGMLAPVVVATLAAAIAPSALAFTLSRPSGGAATALLLVQWLAVVVLALSAFARLRAIARMTLAAAGVALAGIGILPLVLALFGSAFHLIPGTAYDLLDRPVVSIVRTAIILGLLAFLALNASIRVTVRTVASGLTAPALALAALAGFALILDVPARAATTLLPRAGWLAVASGGATVVIVSAAFVMSLLAAVLTRRMPQHAPLRIAADAGGLTITLFALLWTPPRHGWLVLAALAALAAAGSVCRGWRAAGTKRSDADIADPALAPAPRASHEGVAAASDRWRRLFIWPAVALGSMAWVNGVDTFVSAPEPELFALPVAVILAALCALLLWLRRSTEAAIAIVLSVGTGGVILGVRSIWGAPERGVIIGIVAAVVALVVAWSPLRRVGAVGSAGAATAVVAVLAAVVRHIDSPHLWEWSALLAPTVVAYLAAFGLSRGASRPRATAAALPATVLSAFALMAMWRADEAPALSVTLGVLAAIHLAAAALGRAPLGALSRWTALSAAVLVTIAALAFGDYEPLEAVTFPVAALILLGVAVASRRHGQAVSEMPAWIAGLLMAILPSTLAPLDGARSWSVIGVALLAAVVAASLQHPLARVAMLLLTFGALLMGARTLTTADPELLPALVAGLGGIGVGAITLWRQRADARGTLMPPILGVVLCAAASAIGGTGGLLSSALVTAGATGLGVVGAWRLPAAGWNGFSSVLALGGGATAVLATLRRMLGPDMTATESALWPLAALLALSAVSVVALWRSRDRTVGAGAGTALGLGAVIVAVGEVSALGALGSMTARFVAGAAMVVFTGLAVTGHLLRRRLTPALVIAAVAGAVVFAVAAYGIHEVRPLELLTAPAAIGLLAVGTRTLARVAHSRSWPTLGPGLALLTVPSLAHDFGPAELWRIVALGLFALGLIVLGAARRLQAPLVLGSIILFIHAVAQLWPWIAAAYTAVPWWLWAGLAGVVLILAAVRYERQKVALRKAFVAITALR